MTRNLIDEALAAPLSPIDQLRLALAYEDRPIDPLDLPDLDDLLAEIDELEAEVAKAREEGRKAGLEQAAKECDRIAGETRMAYSSERRRAAGMCGAAIRSLPKTSTKEGEE